MPLLSFEQSICHFLPFGFWQKAAYYCINKTHDTKNGRRKPQRGIESNYKWSERRAYPRGGGRRAHSHVSSNSWEQLRREDVPENAGVT